MSASMESDPSTDGPTSSVAGQESKSYWFSLPAIITNQLSNISSSLMHVTSKVGAVANTLVEKTSPQDSSTSVQIEPSAAPNPEMTESKKDLSTIFNDLGSTVAKGAQQFKHAVGDTSFLGYFTKEHDKFLTEKRAQQRREETAVPPWVGYVEEEEMKKQILALARDKRNFLRTLPPGANYHFDMSAVYPVAMATLEADEHLKQMRFDLVPKQINEETFWRNYFYRVGLIKQATQLTALTNEQSTTQPTEQKLSSTNEQTRRTSDTAENVSDIHSEFLSEDYDTSVINMEDIRREIEQLSRTKPTEGGSDLDESEWDKGLTDELDNVSPEELEAQINQMLKGDTK